MFPDGLRIQWQCSIRTKNSKNMQRLFLIYHNTMGGPYGGLLFQGLFLPIFYGIFCVAFFIHTPYTV